MIITGHKMNLACHRRFYGMLHQYFLDKVHLVGILQDLDAE